MSMLSSTGSLLSKAFKDDPGGRNLLNAFTGKKLKGRVNAGIALGGLGIFGAAGYGTIVADKYDVGPEARARRQGTIDYSRGIPSLAYEGRANLNQSTGKYDLGADGDLVLAMSANRKRK